MKLMFGGDKAPSADFRVHETTSGRQSDCWSDWVHYGWTGRQSDCWSDWFHHGQKSVQVSSKTPPADGANVIKGGEPEERRLSGAGGRVSRAILWLHHGAQFQTSTFQTLSAELRDHTSCHVRKRTVKGGVGASDRPGGQRQRDGGRVHTGANFHG